MKDANSISSLSRRLAESTSLNEVKAIRSEAEALRVYAKSAALGILAVNAAAEVKLMAERKTGDILDQLHLKGGDRKSGKRCTLADLGVNYSQSKRWQQMASVSDSDFVTLVKHANETGHELTSASLLRLGSSVCGSKASSPRCDLVRDSDLRLVISTLDQIRQNHEMIENTVDSLIDVDSPEMRRCVGRFLNNAEQLTQQLRTSLDAYKHTARDSDSTDP